MNCNGLGDKNKRKKVLTYINLRTNGKKYRIANYILVVLLDTNNK